MGFPKQMAVHIYSFPDKKTIAASILVQRTVRKEGHPFSPTVFFAKEEKTSAYPSPLKGFLIE